MFFKMESAFENRKGPVINGFHILRSYFGNYILINILENYMFFPIESAFKYSHHLKSEETGKSRLRDILGKPENDDVIHYDVIG